jgi:hypothetical protein
VLMSRKKIVALVLALCSILFVASCERSGTRVSQNSPVSFSKNVAPILYKHCVSHRPEMCSSFATPTFALGTWGIQSVREHMADPAVVG